MSVFDLSEKRAPVINDADQLAARLRAVQVPRGEESEMVSLAISATAAAQSVDRFNIGNRPFRVERKNLRLADMEAGTWQANSVVGFFVGPCGEIEGGDFQHRFAAQAEFGGVIRYRFRVFRDADQFRLFVMTVDAKSGGRDQKDIVSIAGLATSPTEATRMTHDTDSILRFLGHASPGKVSPMDRLAHTKKYIGSLRFVAPMTKYQTHVRAAIALAHSRYPKEVTAFMKAVEEAVGLQKDSAEVAFVKIAPGLKSRRLKEKDRQVGMVLRILWDGIKGNPCGVSKFYPGSSLTRSAIADITSEAAADMWQSRNGASE